MLSSIEKSEIILNRKLMRNVDSLLTFSISHLNMYNFKSSSMFSSMKKQQRSTVCGAVSIRLLMMFNAPHSTSSKNFLFRFPQEKCRICVSLSLLIVSNKISTKFDMFVGWSAWCDWLDPCSCIRFSAWQVLGIDIAQGCKGMYRCFCLFF